MFTKVIEIKKVDEHQQELCSVKLSCHRISEDPDLMKKSPHSLRLQQSKQPPVVSRTAGSTYSAPGTVLHCLAELWEHWGAHGSCEEKIN